MTTSSHPSSSWIENFLTLAWFLKFSNELEDSTSFVVIIQVPKRQSNQPPIFSEPDVGHEDTGTNI